MWHALESVLLRVKSSVTRPWYFENSPEPNSRQFITQMHVNLCVLLDTFLQQQCILALPIKIAKHSSYKIGCSKKLMILKMLLPFPLRRPAQGKEQLGVIIQTSCLQKMQAYSPTKIDIPRRKRALRRLERAHRAMPKLARPERNVLVLLCPAASLAPAPTATARMIRLNILCVSAQSMQHHCYEELANAIAFALYTS